MPQFRVEASKPFETTGVDFAGPIAFKIAKKEQGKCYILLFSCHVEGGTFRIHEDPDGKRISDKVKLVHNQEDKAQGHDIR